MKAVSFDFGEKYKEEFVRLKKEDIELKYTPYLLNKESVEILDGEEIIIVTTASKVDKEMARLLKEKGVRCLLTTSAGYEHLDILALKKQGITVGNVPSYSPRAISEYVVMTLLMSLRNMKKQMDHVRNFYFVQDGTQGRELGKEKIGIIGGGRIGFETIKLLKAFTEEIYVYDPFPREEIERIAAYTELEWIYKNCTVIVFHSSLHKENYHMINEKSISLMKEGVLLVNPSRGGLFDYQAVLKGLKSGKIRGLVFDVYEGEEHIIGKTFQKEEIKDDVFLELIEREDVIYTTHTAYYTKTAVENIVKSILSDVLLFAKEEKVKFPL